MKFVKLYSLKTCKATGEDKLLNEYFIEASDILAGFLTYIFNKILATGVFPEAWTRGLIIPIHKKDSKSDASNSRGITLLSNFRQLFTSALNNRISLWCILHSIINTVLNENNELLEAVDHVNYLGITFNYTGNFKINIETIYGKGVKAMNSLISNINKYKTNRK